MRQKTKFGGYGWRLALGLGLALSCSAFAVAGPLGIGGLPGIPLSPLQGPLQNPLGTLSSTTSMVGGIVRDSVGRPQARNAFDKDESGARVVKGEVVAVAPASRSLALAGSLGFSVLRRESLPALGLDIAILGTPDGMSASEALAALRKADPQGSYDCDHIYDPSGDAAPARASPPAAASASARAPVRIGMIDAGIDRKHPAFADATIVARNVAGKGDAPASLHGTAVASLLVGHDDDFHGALPGATLYAADVFGGQATGGSADDIARGLGWLAANNIGVVNVSLAGPPDALLAAAVKAFVNRGGIVVAAVGNNGPAAPRSYPAGYPGVAAVTSVDADRDVQVDASAGAGFAALGVDVRAAKLGHGYTDVTGTSYAAPVVTARFAVLVPRADAALAARAWNTLEHAAVHMPAATYGYLDPPSVSAAAAMR